MLNAARLALFLVALSSIVSASFHLRSPFATTERDQQLEKRTEEGQVCSLKRSLLEADLLETLPLLKLVQRDSPTVDTPPVTAQIGPVNAGIGNVSVSIGNVSVAAGDIDIENISIGNVTVIVSVAFNAAGASPTSNFISNPATSIATSTQSGPTTITGSTGPTARSLGLLEERQAPTTTDSDSTSTSVASTTSAPETTSTGTPTTTSTDDGAGGVSAPGVSVSLPAPTVSGGAVSVGTDSIGAQIGNINVSVGNINVTLGSIKLKNVTIGNILVLVKLGEDQPTNSTNSNLLGGLIGAL